MLTVLLLSLPGPAKASPRFIDYSVRQEGGYSPSGKRYQRVGNRWECDFTFLMPLEARRSFNYSGREWLALLRQARIEGGRIKWHPQRLDVGAPGAPIIAADCAANVAALPIAGTRPGYIFKLGQAVNLIVNGNLSLHTLSAEVVAAGDGTAVLPLDPRTRVACSIGDVIGMEPFIEGEILGDEQAWDQGPDQIVSISFVIREYGVDPEPEA